MNTAVNAPSPKMRLKKLGNLNATFTQSALLLAPKTWARKISLNNPLILDSRVKKATINPERNIDTEGF